MDAAPFSPLAFAVLVISIGVVYAAPRHFAIAALLASTVLLTIAQSVTILGANFFYLRIVLLAGWVRVLAKSESNAGPLSSIDKAFLYWTLFSIIVAFIPKPIDPRAVEPPATFMSTFINRGGFALDSLGTYFLTRRLVRSSTDVLIIVRVLIGICLVVACAMTAERLTGRNVFFVFGGVPEISALRDGRFRCQGPFTHPIHAGNFGATLIPLCVGLYLLGQKRAAIVGVIAATIVTVEANSSGALMAWVYGVFGLLFWPLRHKMKYVRRALVAATVILHFSMTAPVWWAISRVADFTGGGGYWRSKLIDEFVDHISEWWLMGTNYTAHWSPTGHGLPMYPDNMDLTNQYVVEGVHGGVLCLALYILLLVRCFKGVGQAVTLAETNQSRDAYLSWALGCTLLAYMASFLSVAGSAQTDILFYITLASIAFISQQIKDPVVSSTVEPDTTAQEPLSAYTHQ